jgi:DNA (cytosine-5)-methyltransferase 3A
LIVLSLFDGISCGQVALERAGIKVDKYYVSEIEKASIIVTQKNYPNTIQLGDINNWKEWNIEKPDLILAGSPCQGFSFAGKQLNFNDPRSKLFFTFVDILKYYKPKYFLLENVKMKKEYKEVISEKLGEVYPDCIKKFVLFGKVGLEPILINSSLVSAQNRERLYWTNIKRIKQPKNKKIILKDILEKNVDIKYNFKEKEKNSMILHKNKELLKGNGFGFSILDLNKKSNCLTASSLKENIININRCIQIGKVDNDSKFEMNNRIYSIQGKSPTSCTNNNIKIENENDTWRRLTPVECERLQTISDNYTFGVSDNARYKMLGNGWTVDVITHILSYIK